MNNLSYQHPSIINFYENNYQKNLNEKLFILYLKFFFKDLGMYYLIINPHVNLISVQTRFFFTYYPLLIFSNLKIIELIDLSLIKRKYLTFYLKGNAKNKKLK